MCRPGSGNIKNLPEHENLRVVECDLSDLRFLDGMTGGRFDGFYHLGWAGSYGGGRNSAELQLLNVQYTLDALEAAKNLGCRFFLGAGSQAEYGLMEAAADENTPERPQTMYGAAKLSAGALSRVKAAQLGLFHIWVRIFSVFGPYDEPRTLIYHVIRSLLNGETPALTAATQIWDYLYADDAARALELAAQKGKNGALYCVGGGESHPLREYIERVRDIVSPGAKLGFGEIPTAPNALRFLSANISRLKRDTGFSPETPFEEGIKKTLLYIKGADRFQC